jgi:RNA polymerase sigma-70 factor, ECF subfamily
MMRITEICRSDSVVHFRLEGRLTERVLAELRAALDAVASGEPSLLLDLRGVSFATAGGVETLLDLQGRGAVLMGCSGFLCEMLQRAARAVPSADVAGRALVDRIRGGERAAFTEVVEIHGGRLLAAARRLLRDEDEARDALQDGLLSAFKSIDTFSGEAQLSTWLHRIVVNAALMRLRRRKRRGEQPIDELLPRFVDDGHWEVDPSRSALPSDELVERDQTRRLVRRCIDRLPDAYRTVLLLRDIEDLDTEETAAVLGDTSNAVKVRLHRARQALRTLIERELQEGKPAGVRRIEETEMGDANR